MKTLRNILSSAVLALLCSAFIAPMQAYGHQDTVAEMTAEAAQEENEPPYGTTAYYEQKVRKDFKEGRWEEGKTLLDEGIKKYSQMSALHELMGKYYTHTAETRHTADSIAYYDKARYHLIRAIDIDEKNVQARFLMLKVETETKHYSSAIVYCNDLLEENPYNEDLWRKKIDLYRKIGNNAEADLLLERLCTIYPSDDQLKKDLIERMTDQAKHQRDNGDFQTLEQTLRQLVDYEPNNADHHRALINLLYRTGRVAEAAEAAGRAAVATSLSEFVDKRASMLSEMNRHSEAINYVKGLMAKGKNAHLARLLTDLEEEAARASQYNDVFITYAKLYDSQHSIEALDFLVNTSIQRWYLDDAAMYIEESLKRKGKTEKMLYNQYLIQKRLGNTRKANALLIDLYDAYPDNEDVSEEAMLLLLDKSSELITQEQYLEAIPLLDKIISSKAYPYIRDAAVHRLFNCYYQTRQFTKAEKLLAQMEGSKMITLTASLYNEWGKPKKALDFLANAYFECPDSLSDNKNLISYTYESIALPYIKELLAVNRVNDAHKQLKEAIEICPDNIDIIRYGITTAQRKGEADDVVQYVLRGRKLYPNDPYFILKEAQLRHIAGNNEETLKEIAPLLEEYGGDSMLIALYVETNLELAKDYLAAKEPDKALSVLKAALELDPDNSELYYYQGKAYEQKKEWELAYLSYRKYKPGVTEVGEHKHLLEEMFHHTLRNSLSFEYQQARPGNEDIISGNAYVNYSHICNSRTNFDIGLAYAGRDGASSQGHTEMTKGGTGLQLSGGLEHDFTKRFSAKFELAAATRYFPIIMARATGNIELPRQWMLTPFASFRLLRSYAGTYGWQKPVIGFDKVTETPIYGDAEYIRLGWHESKKSIIQLGLGATKTIENFSLGGELSGLLFGSTFYFNSNLKLKFFPQDGSKSNLFAVAGAGTAPESSLIDRSMPVVFNKLNTFVGLGGSYFVNRSITLNISGTWYTMLSQSERLATTYIANDPYIQQDYRNYFYIHGGVIISFGGKKKALTVK